MSGDIEWVDTDDIEWVDTADVEWVDTVGAATAAVSSVESSFLLLGVSN